MWINKRTISQNSRDCDFYISNSFTSLELKHLFFYSFKQMRNSREENQARGDIHHPIRLTTELFICLLVFKKYISTAKLCMRRLSPIFHCWFSMHRCYSAHSRHSRNICWIKESIKFIVFIFLTGGGSFFSYGGRKNIKFIEANQEI